MCTSFFFLFFIVIYNQFLQKSYLVGDLGIRMLSAGIEPMQNVERLVVSALLDIDAGEGFGEEALFAILGAVVGALVDLGHKLGCLVANYLARVLVEEVGDKAWSVEVGCL